ncbi:MAG: RAMP superfamily CRISPR-associated protein [Cyanobacteriota bacterium]
MKSPLFDRVVAGVLEGTGGYIPTQVANELAQKVPLEYQAQTTGRCQRQFIKKSKETSPGWRSPIEAWLDQWVERVDSRSPFTSKGLRLVEVQIDWRLISNSGLDEGFIRPVTGAGGWPLIPGSSIKGLFRRSCRKTSPERLLQWCGGVGSDGEETKLIPGLLRFHGAWPVDAQWTSNLLDLAHPQQEWQVGIPSTKRGGAFGVVSLYQPKLQIGLSSAASLEEKEWQEIEETLRTALDMGIGGRTCVGYGSSGRLHGDVLFQCGLEGQGPAAKLLAGTPEFRPTMFRAAIRGMALRLFGGVTDARTARLVVGRLFGSINPVDAKDVNVGLLATAYTDATWELGSFGWTNNRQPTYATTGRLQWRQARRCEQGEDEALLAELLAALHGLTMGLGGFGRSWRRPDHRIFFPRYDKTPIGCHWQWRNADSLPSWLHVQSPEALARLLRQARAVARRWLEATGQPIGEPAPWREVIHPARMRIWTRRASEPTDAQAVAWFHREASSGDGAGQAGDPRDLKHSELAGQMNQVGLIWNRLLPLHTPADHAGQAKPAPAAAPLARPANPTSRPPNPKARSTATRQPAPLAKGDVSISAHPGAYLESLVLHSLLGGGHPEARLHHQRFIAAMDRGANVNFRPLEWS